MWKYISGLIVLGAAGFAIIQNMNRPYGIHVPSSHFESYDSAVRTFYNRYKSFPGDIPNVDRFYDVKMWPMMRNGNGDGELQICAELAVDSTCASPEDLLLVADAGEGAALVSGESTQFWHHLAAAELIPGYYNGCGALLADNTECGRANYAFPMEVSSKPPYIHGPAVTVYGDGKENYYQIVRFPSDVDYRLAGAVTPEYAYQIDKRLDDGLPGTGKVQFRSAKADGSSYLNQVPQSEDGGFEEGNVQACVNEQPAGAEFTAHELERATYARDNENLACSLRIRMWSPKDNALAKN